MKLIDHLLVAVTFATLGTTGCGGGGSHLPDDLGTIAAQPAQGDVMGTPFTLGTRFMNVDGPDLYVDLLTDAADDCTLDETTGSYPLIIFSAPSVAGRYELGDSLSVTFVDAPSDNLIVSNGVVVIDSITPTTVSGGLHVFDEQFGEINGRFDGKLCFGL